GQLAALGLHDPRAGVVLAGDQLDVILLALLFGGDRRGQFGVVSFDACVAREHVRSRRPVGTGHCSSGPRPGRPRGGTLDPCLELARGVAPIPRCAGTSPASGGRCPKGRWGQAGGIPTSTMPPLRGVKAPPPGRRLESAPWPRPTRARGRCSGPAG